MLTEEIFVSVFKSISEEDFNNSATILKQIEEKFKTIDSSEHFTESEREYFISLSEKFNNEVVVGTLVSKFKEKLCLQ